MKIVLNTVTINTMLILKLSPLDHEKKS